MNKTGKSNASANEIRTLYETTSAKEILRYVTNCIHSYNRNKSYLLSEDEVQDIIGETCYRIYANHSMYIPDKGSLKAWVGTISFNCYNDCIRRRRVKRNTISSLEQISEHKGLFYSKEVFPDESEIILNLVLEQLPDSYRNAILCLTEGIEDDNERMARIKCSEKNLRSTICRAKKSVRPYFKTLGL